METLRDEGNGGKGRLDTQRRELRTARGDLVTVNMTASIIYEDGDEVATVGVFSDLRERIIMERQLSEAQEQLMNTEKARVAAELAGMAAHELNQPLTSVLGYAEMLKRRIAEEDRSRRPVDIIFREAERMSEIVRKIGRITTYETKVYGASTMMMDLEKASAPDKRKGASLGGAGPSPSDDEDDTGKQKAAPGPSPTSRVPRPHLKPETEASTWWKAAKQNAAGTSQSGPSPAVVNSVIRADTVDPMTARRVAERRMAESKKEDGPFSKDADEVTRRIKLDHPLDDA
jgi:hypothetical protein